MTDLRVEQTDRGRWAIKSDFNDATLQTKKSRDTAVETARDMAYYQNGTDDPVVKVILSPKPRGGGE